MNSENKIEFSESGICYRISQVKFLIIKNK